MPEVIVALLGVASLGAIWSIYAPDMGTNAVLDRFEQVAPMILIASESVRQCATQAESLIEATW